MLDVPGLQDLLRKLSTREIALVEVETQTASPFASSLLFDYVAAYMYEGDTPAAERRAVALSLDRELLRELLGQEELRDLIDPAALEQVEDDLQHRSDHLRARDADALHDVLRRVGDLTEAEAAERTEPPGQAAAWLARLEDERRAVRARLGGEERWLAAEDAGLFRDALGVVPPGGLPDAFLEDVPDAMLKLLRRYARSHGPFETREVHDRYGVDPGPGLAELERAGGLVLGELRPNGTQREWCDPDVLRRVRRASLAVLRKEIEPVGQQTLARFAPAWQGVDRFAAAGAGVGRLRDVLAPLQGLPLAPEVWEKDVLPRRLGTYSPYWLDELCASGEVVWVGAGPLGARTGRVALYFRDDAPLLGPPAAAAELPAGALHEALRERLGRGACFYSDLLVELPDVSSEELREALWDLTWAGEVTNDAFAPLRSRGLKAVAAPAAGRRAGSGRFRRRTRGAPPLQGRWSLAADIFRAAPDDVDARRRAWAELLLERHGVLTRELVRAEGFPGGFAALYPALSALETLGAARRGYFVEGLGGAQFALPGAVERLRALEDAPDQALVVATADPAQLYGAGLRWPDADARPPARRPGGTAGHRRRPAGALRPRRWQVLARAGPAGRRAAGPRGPRGGGPRRPPPPPGRRHHRRRAGREPVHSPSASSPWVSAGASTTLRSPPAMPEGDTLHHAALLVGGGARRPRARRDRDTAPALRPRPLARAPRRSQSRVRRGGRQAPPHPLRGRPRHPLAPAHDGRVARAPRR